jgi:acetylornithine/LysW-gamma-L-lysine aminotransferase
MPGVMDGSASQGPTTMSDEVIGLEDGYGSGLYVKQPLVLTRGEGARVWDAEGNAYVDCVGGHGVANVGHANPAVVEAVTRQVRRLVTAPNGFYNDQRARLLAALVRIAPAGLERAYLCNSGAEAVEAAFKFARLATGRRKIVSTMRGFHGRTLGALSATWHKAYREPFEPLVPGFTFVPYDSLERMAQAVDGETAAVILEVVQGEGGVNPGGGDYLHGVQALCRERGALLIVDEVQTGFGRTGKMFACQHHGLEPDLMCSAKAMAGGVPMGAVLLGPRVGDLPKKVHGSTFGGNPLSCAAALAAIRFIECEDLPGRAARLGERLVKGLQAIDSPRVREVRGMGLMVGLQLRGRVGSCLAALAEPVDGLGVLALTAGSTVMRFLPPLVIDEGEVDVVVERVARVLTMEE